MFKIIKTYMTYMLKFKKLYVSKKINSNTKTYMHLYALLIS